MNYNLIGQYRGEECVTVLSGQDESAAMTIAERIRRDCHRVQNRGAEGGIVSLTVNIGVTELRGTDTIETLNDRVGKGLYRAKMKGRDTTVLVGNRTRVSNYPEPLIPGHS